MLSHDVHHLQQSRWQIPLNEKEETTYVTKRKGKRATVEEAVPPTAEMEQEPDGKATPRDMAPASRLS